MKTPLYNFLVLSDRTLVPNTRMSDLVRKTTLNRNSFHKTRVSSNLIRRKNDTQTSYYFSYCC